MYAIFNTGGKLYKVMEGQIINVERLKLQIKNKIEFNNLLMIVNGNEIKIGNSLLKKNKITAEIISHFRNKKNKIIKFKRRKHYKKSLGHRQNLTKIKILSIIF